MQPAPAAPVELSDEATARSFLAANAEVLFSGRMLCKE
jgi:hypothetical protein